MGVNFSLLIAAHYYLPMAYFMKVHALTLHNKMESLSANIGIC